MTRILEFKYPPESSIASRFPLFLFYSKSVDLPSLKPARTLSFPNGNYDRMGGNLLVLRGSILGNLSFFFGPVESEGCHTDPEETNYEPNDSPYDGGDSCHLLHIVGVGGRIGAAQDNEIAQGF